MDETNIAWDSDKEHKFTAVPEAVKAENRDKYKFINETYPGIESVENEHFIVWMRAAALPRFRKLYGRIRADLEEGDTLQFRVHDVFDVDSFDGKKSLVISTTSWLGGKNDFLGIAYIVVGSVCLALMVSFFVKEQYCPRKPGDVSYLRWTQR